MLCFVFVRYMFTCNLLYIMSGSEIQLINETELFRLSSLLSSEKTID